MEEDRYAEYCDQAFLKLLNVILEKVSLEDFWSSGGTQWDGFGKSNLGLLEVMSLIIAILEVIELITVQKMIISLGISGKSRIL